VVSNCAPAVSQGPGLLYVAVSDGAFGYLVALDLTTLQPVARSRLKDPQTGLDAVLADNGSASPTVGPDGDVYFGVLESAPGDNHYRGWLLHFDSRLSQSKTTGAFGWDDTASIVSRSMVPSYAGASPYLVMTKYNDYSETGGTGLNRIAVLDPGATQRDAVTGIPVMKEILTIAGPTASTTSRGVKEWCINSAAVDPATKSILAGSEDGKLYRWDLSTNSFSQSITLTAGIGEAYTPTVIGPDGTVYAINDGILFAIGQ
jgi:WD40 repeat protein